MNIKELRRRLSYNPITGNLIWISKNKMHPRLFRMVAGSNRPDGRRYVQIFGRSWPASRLAFYIMTGRCPKIVDHINGNSADNRWKNLRPATSLQNSWNITTLSRKKKSALPVGVRRMSSGKFQARLAAKLKTFYIGTFESADAAHRAYLKKKRGLHGEFCRKS
jgi:hypothetical protein